MRVLVHIAIIAAVLTGGIALTHLPTADPAPPVTNRERWTALCRIEAPRSVAECVDRYALGAAFANSNAAHEAAVRAAGR